MENKDITQDGGTFTVWILQARLREKGENGRWETMGGFTYRTREELQEVYEKHFRAIEDGGCQYRFATITETWEFCTP